MPNNKKQILIVDDTESNIDLLVATFGDEYDLRVALDGETALKILEKDPLPDLILLDIVMPGMGGYELCKQLKECERTHRIRIIFLTSLNDTKEQEKGLLIGAEDYIIKPFDPAIVKARVRTQLELKSYRDNLEEQVLLRTSELAHAQEATIASLAIMAEFRDPETGAHIQRTKSYIHILATELRKSHPDIVAEHIIPLFSQAAPLHDIGKVGIPDSILLKPGRLTAEEFKTMENHTILGSEAIQRTKTFYGENQLLSIAAQIAEFHHEKWDGSGYPHGLREEQIPLVARLMTIVDVYDALISTRPYKKAFSHEEAVHIILNGDGYTQPNHFEPRILSCFKQNHLKLMDIAQKFTD